MFLFYRNSAGHALKKRKVGLFFEQQLFNNQFQGLGIILPQSQLTEEHDDGGCKDVFTAFFCIKKLRNCNYVAYEYKFLHSEQCTVNFLCGATPPLIWKYVYFYY